MLNLSSSKIYLYQEPADMRKSFKGLYSLVCANFPEAELSGSLFVFLNKRQNFVKALYWDGDGFALWAKRLRQGCFRRLENENPVITRREMLMLLEGISPKRLNKRFSLKKTA